MTISNPPAPPPSQAPSPRTKMVAAIAVAVIALAILYWVRNVIFITFFGVLLGLLMNAIAGALVRWLRLPRALAVTLAGLAVVAALAGIVALIAVPLTEQISRLGESLPQYEQSIERRLAGFRETHPGLAFLLPQAGAPAKTPDATKVAGTAIGAAFGAIEALITIVAILFMGFFFALDPDRYVRGVAALWPGRDASQVRLLYRIGEALKAWMVAAGIEMLVVGTLWSLGLRLAGIEYYLVFGIVGGFLQILPYLGPLLALAPPLFIALATNPQAAIAVFLVYVAIHLFDGFILLPFLLDARVNVPPVAVLVAIMALGSAFGFWGTLLSMPILTVIYVLVNELYLKPEIARPDERPLIVPGGAVDETGGGQPMPGPA